MSLVLPVIPTSLPQGFCPADYQEMLNSFDAHSSVTVPDGSLGGMNVSASQPTDKTRPWFQLDVSGRPVRIYWFAQGAWLSQHPMVPGTTIWWFDTIPVFTTFDGGDSLTPNPTALTGPMWQVAKLSNGTAIAAQFPIVAGTLPSGTVLAVGDTGGEEEVTLTSEQAGPGALLVNSAYMNKCAGGSTTEDLHHFSLNGVQIGGHVHDGLDMTDVPVPLTASEVPNTPHNNMPPYVVGYLLQRTSKLFYSVF